jgi:hypothetical protein
MPQGYKGSQPTAKMPSVPTSMGPSYVKTAGSKTGQPTASMPTPPKADRSMFTSGPAKGSGSGDYTGKL